MHPEGAEPLPSSSEEFHFPAGLTVADSDPLVRRPQGSGIYPTALLPLSVFPRSPVLPCLSAFDRPLRLPFFLCPRCLPAPVPETVAAGSACVLLIRGYACNPPMPGRA